MFNRVWNHYFHHPFWDTPIFGNTHISCDIPLPIEFRKVGSRLTERIPDLSWDPIGLSAWRSLKFEKKNSSQVPSKKIWLSF